MKKYLLLAIIVIVTLCSCNESNTTVQKEIPLTVVKLVKSNTFDTLTVIKDKDYLYIFEQGEYKESIEITNHTGKIAIATFIIGLLTSLIIYSIFSD